MNKKIKRPVLHKGDTIKYGELHGTVIEDDRSIPDTEASISVQTQYGPEIWYYESPIVEGNKCVIVKRAPAKYSVFKYWDTEDEGYGASVAYYEVKQSGRKPICQCSSRKSAQKIARLLNGQSA